MTDVETEKESATEFVLPPLVHNARGEVRKAGFELEYSGVDITQSAAIVRKVFGGEHLVESTFGHKVRTRYGDFQVEIDTAFLKDKEYERALRAVGVDPDAINARWIEEALLSTLGVIVPTEIASPAMPITELGLLDELRRCLKEAGANGTRKSVFYAFGMHINPEVPSEEPGVLLDYLRAFVLLYPRLRREGEIDWTRELVPYIRPFPEEYVKLILRDDYPATAERLIEDYLEHNPTRNRPLDMLPVFVQIDRETVMNNVEEGKLVKGRPAFHYRLPNCMVDEEGWTLAAEWNRWVEVERLANDVERLRAMARGYLNS